MPSMTTSTAGDPRLHVTPDAPALDTPLRIHLTGAPAGSRVRLTCAMHDAGGSRHAASATYVADDRGEVDVSARAPVSGDYSGVDAMGLVWSMRPRPEAPRAPGSGGPLDPLPMTLDAEIDGTAVARCSFERQRLPDGISRTEVRQAGLVGTLFHALDGTAHPGVILIGGSEGGLHEVDAALLAAHGFSVLALAYFGMPGVPPTLVDIPLEYFATAVAYLQTSPSVAGERVGIMGGSRGGEAALLAAAMFDGIAAVVSTVGSAVVTQGIPRAASLPDILRTPAASWTYRGTPLPYLPYTVTDQLEESVRTGAPVELRTAFVPALGDREIVKRATIPVERIQGGVLLISAGDDRMWPSGPLSDIALPRLQRARHPYPYRHLHHDAAGHAIAPPPFGPTTARTSPGPGVTFAHGGTPEADAHARADAWQRSIAFLGELLAGQRPGHR